MAAQAPFRRAGGGIVTWDQTLDIVARANLAWRWKDQDQLDLAARWGWMTPDEVRLVRDEGERVARMIGSRAAPFSEPWPDWRPDPAWPVPALPADWAIAGVRAGAQPSRHYRI